MPSRPRPFRILSGSVIGAALLMLVVAAVTPAAAQSLGAVEPPFDAVVTAQRAPLRAGGSDSFYIVGHVSRGQTLNVRAIIGSWYQVVPPTGVFSLAPKAHIDARSDGRTGIVNRTRTYIRAAGVNGDDDRVHFTLSQGAQVTILGEQGAYYRIAPPEGALVFINTDDARPKRATDLVDPQPSSTQPPANTAANTTTNPRNTAAAQQPRPAPAKPVAPVEITIFGDGQFDLGGTRRPIAKLPTMLKLLADNQADYQIRLTIRAGRSAPYSAVSAALDDARRAGLTDVRLAATSAAGNPTNNTANAPASSANPGTNASSTADASDASDDPTDAAAGEPADASTTADASNAADADPTSDDAGQPADDQALAQAIEEPDASAPPAPADMSLEQAEAELAQAFALPLDRQPLDRLTQVYDNLDARDSLDETQAALVDTRRAQIEYNRKLLQAKASLASTRQSLAALPADGPDYTPPAPTPDVVGRIAASSVFNGIHTTRLLRVVDPQTGRTLSYVDPTDEPRLVAMLGREVGIVGTAVDDPRLGVRIVQVQSLVMVDQPDAPQSDAPTDPAAPGDSDVRSVIHTPQPSDQP